MTKLQKQLAAALRKARPAVFPGSNVVINESARAAWYAACCEIAEVACGESPRAAHEFFNIAGVPD